MISRDDLKDQMDILQNVIHFVAEELRSMPRPERMGSEQLQALLDDLYEVLDRHGYHGIIKLVGELAPQSRQSGSVAWGDNPHGDVYFFKK